MRTTILQTDIVWADPKSNTAHADTWIDENPGSDLYVFPEMFTTGFATHPTGISESEEGASLSWMKRKSAKTGAAICGSMSNEAERVRLEEIIKMRKNEKERIMQEIASVHLRWRGQVL